MTINDRRNDSSTSMKIAFALRIKRAFGAEVAHTFTETQRLEKELAKVVMEENNDRRQKVRRVNQRAVPRAHAPSEQ